MYCLRHNELIYIDSSWILDIDLVLIKGIVLEVLEIFLINGEENEGDVLIGLRKWSGLCQSWLANMFTWSEYIIYF